MSARGTSRPVFRATARLLAAGAAVFGWAGTARAVPPPPAPARPPGQAMTRPPATAVRTPAPVATTGAVDAADPETIARRWGIRLESLRLTASGHMLDLRYRVVDARKARPLFERRTRPILRDEKSGVEMAVPVPPKTGALRSSNDPQAGRTYFMFFANPGGVVGPGSRMTLTIGPFRVGGMRVEEPDGPASLARVMVPQPVLGDVALVDHTGRATSLREVVDTDEPVLVNFVFTSCQTVCPIMTAGFARFQEQLGEGRDHVRLVSISIDPETDSVETLRAYAARHRAGASWRFLTGTPATTEAAQRAFGAYRGDRNNHAPATYLRRTRDSPWEVLDGLASAGTLLGAYRRGPAVRPF